MCGAIVSILHCVTMDVRCDCFNSALRHDGCAVRLFQFCTESRYVNWGSHMCQVRPQLSSGGAGADIVLPGHGTSTSL